MPTQSPQHLQITLKEFEIFTEIAKTQSIRETARRYHMEAGQLSRILKRLEAKVGARLVERTAAGVSLTQQGTSALKAAKSILREAGELATLAREGQSETDRIYGFGSTSFLSGRLLAPILGKYCAENPRLRVRLFEVTPDQLTSHAMKGAFDFALHVGSVDWPRSWQTQEVGELRWQLFARSGLKIPLTTSVSAIKTRPFIQPVYWTTEGLAEGNDQCPLKQSQRTMGVATATAETALAVLQNSDQLAFLPEILAREAVSDGRIVQINIREWPPITKPVFLTVRADVVPKKLFEEIAHRVKKAL